MDYRVYFKMVDHSLDDCDFYQPPLESTIVFAQSPRAAVLEFCNSDTMLGEMFDIVEVEECV